MSTLTQIKLETKRERYIDPVIKRRASGKNLGGRRQTSADSPICNAVRLIKSGEQTTQVTCDVGMSRVTLDRRIRDLS